MRVGLVVPHIFMQADILPRVIFSPGQLALDLCSGLTEAGAAVTLFSPGLVATPARNVTADLSAFEAELTARGDDYLDLLRKHPLVFVSLARAVQAELIAKAYAMANAGELDVVHIYMTEEDIALPFAQFCTRPVVFTHHDPFNFAARYRHSFPRFKGLNWVSISMSQRRHMPSDTNWVGNVYHGLWADEFEPRPGGTSDYVAYLGRIVEPKGVHLAIKAVQQYNKSAQRPVTLKIAGKHYSGEKDEYWQAKIAPEVDGKTVEYLGFIRDTQAKGAFLAGAEALLMPSTWDEPFGLSMVEALASGTPVIGLDSGSIPEVVRDGTTGIVVPKTMRRVADAKSGHPHEVVDDAPTVAALAAALARIGEIDRRACRAEFEARFTLEQMAAGYLDVYQRLMNS